MAVLVLVIEAASVVAPTVAQAQTAIQPNLTCNDSGPADYAVAGGWFYTEAATGCITMRGPDRRMGFTVLDDAQGNFWTGFRRYGDVAVLGYPVSRPYHAPGPPNGYLYQAFQRGILQSQATTGEAHMAPAFDLFAAVPGFEDKLEFMGLATPGPAKPELSFTNDAERRMSWLVDPRFLARYFFDPVAFHSSEPDRPGNTSFGTQEQAWDFFGLPQSMPERMMLRDVVGGNSLWPLAHSFIGQRFSNGGQELFIEDASAENVDISGNGSGVLFDPTIVPGDASNGCVVLTAVGLVARRIGTGTIIPKEAVIEQPDVPNLVPLPSLIAHVPPVRSGQLRTTFELDGANFAAKEQVDVVLTLKSTTSSTPYVDIFVPTTQTDGSFQLIITEDVGTYKVTVTGRVSKNPVLSTTLDLSVPTMDLIESKKSNCGSVGLPVGP